MGEYDHIYKTFIELNKILPFTRDVTPEQLARAIYILAEESEARGFMKAVEALRSANAVLEDPLTQSSHREPEVRDGKAWADWLESRMKLLLRLQEEK